jgi:hypothetical protein
MEQMTQMMQGAGGGDGAPSGGGLPTGAKPPEAGPAGSPAATPQQPKGASEGAKVEVAQAVKVLKGAIAKFPYDSEEYKAVDKALQGLLKKFPAQDSAGLGNAGMVKLMSQSGGMPG